MLVLTADVIADRIEYCDISYMERRYRGSIEYRDTYGGVGIVVPISGIAQHYYKSRRL